MNFRKHKRRTWRFARDRASSFPCNLGLWTSHSLSYGGNIITNSRDDQLKSVHSEPRSVLSMLCTDWSYSVPNMSLEVGTMGLILQRRTLSLRVLAACSGTQRPSVPECELSQAGLAPWSPPQFVFIGFPKRVD